MHCYKHTVRKTKQKNKQKKKQKLVNIVKTGENADSQCIFPFSAIFSTFKDDNHRLSIISFTVVDCFDDVYVGSDLEKIL